MIQAWLVQIGWSSVMFMKAHELFVHVQLRKFAVVYICIYI